MLTGTGLGLLGGAGLAAAMAAGAGYPWIVAAWVLLSAGSGATLSADPRRSPDLITAQRGRSRAAPASRPVTANAAWPGEGGA